MGDLESLKNEDVAMTCSQVRIFHWPKARASLLLCGLIMVLLLVSFFASLSVLFAAEQPSPPKVIILNSYHPGFTWSDNELVGVLQELRRVYPNLDPAIEYLDTKHFPSDEYLLRVKDYLARKYHGQKFDLIIVLDNPALEMVLAHRPELFPETPVVFAGINDFTPAMLAGQEKVTGLAEILDIEGTLKMALDLHPGTTEIFVITDDTISGKSAKREVRAVLPRLPAGVHVEFAPPATMAELVEHIKRLPATAIVFITGFATDKAGQTFSMAEGVSRLTQEAKIPVYIVHEGRLGYGAVGGMLLGGREEGRLAGKIALRVLTGTDPASIPVEMKSPTRPMFDYRQLARFKIPESALPTGSIIINRPSSFYQVNKSLVWGTSGVVLALGLVITVLSISITRRRRAESSLRESEERFRALVENISLGITLIDPDYRIAMTNPAQGKLFHKPVSELIGQKCFRVFEKRESVCSHCPGTIAMATGKKAEVEAKGFLDNGNVITSRIQAFPRFGPDGQITGFIELIEEITQKKQLELERKHHFDFLQNLLNTMPNLVFFKDAAGVYKGCNQAMEEFLGLSKEEIIGKTVFDLYPKDLAIKYEAMDQELFHHPGIQVYEFDMERSDGARRRFISNEATFLDREGGLGGLIGVMTDITERKEAEEALRTSEERYRTVADYTYDMEYWVSPDRNILYMSPACERLTGYPAQAFVDDPTLLDRIVHPEDRALVINHRQEALSPDGMHTLDFRLIHRTGDEFWVNHICQNVYGANGLLLGRRVSNRDITARKEAEAAFQAVMSHAPMGIYIVQKGKFVMVNPGFATLSGYRPEEVLGQDCLTLVTPEYREIVREQAIKRLKGTDLSPYEFQFISKSGEARWVMETVAPTQYKGNRGVLGYFMDITPRKKLEAQFLQAQKMEAVGTLAGGVAHDFNNMLGIIMGHAEIVLMGLKPLDPLYSHLEGIKKASERSATLTRQLLAFSRKQILQPQVINLSDLILDLESMIFRLIREDVELLTVFDQAPTTVKADPAQVEQVILNLTVNALDAMPQGGKLTMETKNVILDEPYCQAHPYVTPGPHVMLAMSDDGLGMDANTQAHIFEPFYTTKEALKGTGLGLSTVYGIVKQSGGSIEVNSELGYGTTIRIYLPKVEEPEAITQTATPTAAMHGNETIVVVEDEDMLRPLIIDVLKGFGYKTLEARHGKEALLVCEQHQGHIHLVLTDVIMPQMSGRVLADKLESLYPGIKVLFMSGHNENAIVHQGVLHEDTSFIQKPFSPYDLVKKVREVLATPFSK